VVADGRTLHAGEVRRRLVVQFVKMGFEPPAGSPHQAGQGNERDHLQSRRRSQAAATSLSSQCFMAPKGLCVWNWAKPRSTDKAMPEGRKSIQCLRFHREYANEEVENDQTMKKRSPSGECSGAHKPRR